MSKNNFYEVYFIMRVLPNIPTLYKKQTYNVAQSIIYKENSPCDTVSFTSSKTKSLEEIKDYIKSYSNNNSDICLTQLDPEELEGIQKGIPVFDGLNMKQILFSLASLMSINLIRGCNNGCVHCYAKAKPPIPETNDTVNRMSYEDFESLIDCVGELTKRAGIKIFDEDVPLSMFYDSDCVDIAIKDKDGKIYDFIDLNEKFIDSTGEGGIFDTAGWYRQDSRRQKRMEKYVEYFSTDKNMQKLKQFNISFNPFNPAYVKSVEHRLAADNFEKKGMIDEFNQEKKEENRWRRVYVDRMANVFYTCTPLFDKEEFNILIKYIGDSNPKFKGYDIEAMQGLKLHIIDALWNRYEDDLEKGDTKFVKNEDDSYKKISLLRQELGLDKVYKNYKLGIIGNLYDFYNKKGEYPVIRYGCKDYIRYTDKKVIDSDGKVYVFMPHYNMVIETDIRFNFKNQNKSTAPVEPEYSNKDQIFNSSDLDELYKQIKNRN